MTDKPILIMDRMFLPIAFSAALHGAVLFGFTKSPKPASIEQITTAICTFFVPPPLELEPVELPPGENKTEERPKPPEVIASPEPPQVDVVSDFRIVPPVATVIDVPDSRTLIPPSLTVPEGAGEGPFGPDVLSSLSLDRVPRVRLQVPPLYPADARRDGRNGQVLVEFIVDETGTVAQARVVDSSDRAFEAAALRAILKWRFEPGQRHGRAVPFRMVIPVVFNLNE